MRIFKKVCRMLLEHKTALITGAAQGFGLGMAQRFSQEGARLVLIDINGQAVAAAAAAIGQGAIALNCDVSSALSVGQAVDRAIDHFGHLDIVVNNAGTTHKNQPMLEVAEAEFDRVFAVNVKSIYLMARAVVPHMRARRQGVILNIGSTAGIRPRPGLTWYNASKGAVNLLTKSMAIELASDRIRVCGLAPVAGETPLLAAFMGEDTPERRALFTSSIPLGRLSTPQDIANAAVFLVSEQASMITGAVLEIDGGRCV
jgi:3-oxoacyl-[acyl-carrier protein] reductase